MAALAQALVEGALERAAGVEALVRAAAEAAGGRADRRAHAGGTGGRADRRAGGRSQQASDPAAPPRVLDRAARRLHRELPALRPVLAEAPRLGVTLGVARRRPG